MHKGCDRRSISMLTHLAGCRAGLISILANFCHPCANGVALGGTPRSQLVNRGHSDRPYEPRIVAAEMNKQVCTGSCSTPHRCRVASVKLAVDCARCC